MLATLQWVAWYNTERLHSACGWVPPEEFEKSYYDRQENLVS
jgi:putative transposase